MADRELTIGQLGSRAGCKVQTIRYYERIGLMPQPVRTQGNQRRYGTRQAERLTFIRHGRQLGFPLEAIRDLLSLTDTPSKSCEAANAMARTQLRQVNSRIKRLLALRREFARMVEECAGGRIADCRVIEVLANHSKCLSEDHHALATT